MKKTLLSILLFACLFTPFEAANSKDATSFNPLPIKVDAQGGSGVPVGTVIIWTSASNPIDDADNWLECNGQTISKAKYPELYAITGSKVPNYQGMFLRGHGAQTHSKNNGKNVGMTSTTHQSCELGKIQGDTVRNVEGQAGAPRGDQFSMTGVFSRGAFAGSIKGGGNAPVFYRMSFDLSNSTPTSNEIRPANTAVRYLIRALP